MEIAAVIGGMTVAALMRNHLPKGRKALLEHLLLTYCTIFTGIHVANHFITDYLFRDSDPWVSSNWFYLGYLVGTGLIGLAKRVFHRQ